jgi:DNA-binding MarR family transcriptional regulator
VEEVSLLCIFHSISRAAESKQTTAKIAAALGVDGKNAKANIRWLKKNGYLLPRRCEKNGRWSADSAISSGIPVI